MDERGDEQLPENRSRSVREALQAALCEVLGSEGPGAVTPERIAEWAGIPVSVFHENFATVDDCFAALCAGVARRLDEAVLRAVGACEPPASREAWHAQVEAGFAAVLELLAREPALARSCLVEAPTMDPCWVSRRDEALERFIRYLDGSRQAAGEPASPLAAELIVRGTYELISARVARGEATRLPELLPDLRYFWTVAFMSSAGTRE